METVARKGWSRCRKHPLSCARCNGVIAVGDVYQWSNLDRKARHVKASDDTCDLAWRPSETESAREVVRDVEMRDDEVTTTPVVVNGAHGGDGAVLQSLAEALGKRLAPTIDRDAVQTIVRDTLASLDVNAAVERAVNARIPSVIEIRRQDAPTVRVENAHYLMARVLKLLAAGIHVYLYGPAGSGKTTMALQACRALGKPDSEIDTLDGSTAKSALLGWRSPTGEHMETAFTRCYATGQGYIADELDNAPAPIQSIKNSALANGHAPAGWGMIQRHDGFVYVGTGNTPGRPTPQFPDRKRMSAAFADRLYFLYVPIDPAIECRAGGLPIPTAPKREERTCTPAQWVGWVQNVRAWCAQHAPEVMVTPRASLTGLSALAAGETPDEVADGLVFRGADAPLRAKILAAVPLPC
jgi:hypothetical protein